MSRINPITPDRAPADVKNIYESLEKKMGRVINIFQYMGNSAVALQAFLQLREAADKTSFSPQIKEQIALFISEENHCHYCLSAHTAHAHAIGLKDPQIIAARKGEAQDPKTTAILRFVRQVIDSRANIQSQEVENLKAVGVTDKEIVELILLISLNLFANYFNIIIDTKNDFPEVVKIS